MYIGEPAEFPNVQVKLKLFSSEHKNINRDIFVCMYIKIKIRRYKYMLHMYIFI